MMVTVQIQIYKKIPSYKQFFQLKIKSFTLNDHNVKLFALGNKCKEY